MYRMKCTSITDVEIHKAKGEGKETQRIVLDGEGDLLGAKIVLINTDIHCETGVYYNISVDKGAKDEQTSSEEAD